MSTRSPAHPPSARVPAALVGLLVGGAAGFLLTETVGAFSAFVLGRALDVAGTGVLLAAFIAVPVICAVLGAVIAVRRAGQNRRSHHRGR
ncbi:hypothetical protein PV379_38300 [Streptomyces caniscabiei]|uniref:hypothetical protein n=1 Tax=Streptomyces caniscabiei TaxID=2746961 RepID=UPI0029BE6B94|nr:hypothetical protein [Streptomyces caniscabiei]MDX2604245.1 hypothetical protein [Streptomyces caniscabiei]MDX2739174.1 hypothetical protein [Streptomyces caniscabiei]MDX2783115.1 hypothetical protein [Streptomyces caniscabiei]